MLLYIAAAACANILAIITFLLCGYFRSKPSQQVSDQPLPVSVVVAARNEATNLPALLDALISQSYPDDLTEIILVDDRSTDETREILSAWSLKHERVKTLNVAATPAGVSPKKHALSQGIAAAQGELIFTTDADCRPPKEWLAKMVPLFTKEVGLAAGLAPFVPEASLFSDILQLDNLAAAFVSAGGVGWQIGITCAGRNLAYRKAVFEEVNGFSEIEASLSGDDDLLLQLVTRKTGWRVAFCREAGAAVPSAAAKTLSGFIRQRRRHVSAGKHYAKGLQLAYLLFNIANLSLFACLVFSWTRGSGRGPITALFLGKLALELLALATVARDMKRLKLLIFFPLWEIFYLLNQTLISPLAFIGKIRWKP